MSIRSTIYNVLLTQDVIFLLSDGGFDVVGFSDVCPWLVSSSITSPASGGVVGSAGLCVTVPVVVPSLVVRRVSALTLVVGLVLLWGPTLSLNVTAAVAVVTHNFTAAVGRSSGGHCSSVVSVTTTISSGTVGSGHQSSHLRAAVCGFLTERIRLDELHEGFDVSVVLTSCPSLSERFPGGW